MSPASGLRGVAIVGLVGLAAGALVTLRLAAVLPEVPNRHAFTYDASRRAMVNVDAADALRRGDLGRALWDVAGPEQWPTLRLLVAAPAHVFAGPARALEVELGVSVASVGLLVLCLVLSAGFLAPRPADALAMAAVACPLLLGNRDLLEHGANAMLEMLEAVFTLAATVAWIRAREKARERPWALALLGNCLFQVKFQHGLFFATAVLALEASGPGWRTRLQALARALGRAARRPWGIAVLALGLGATVLALGIVSSGGAQWTVLGHPVSLGRPRVVRWAAAAAAFGFVSLAFASDRGRLQAALPARVRFAWAWLLTPMALWLLMPFTWRLETLVASTTYDAGLRQLGLLERLGYYARAAWTGWFPPGARWMALALLGGTAVAARISPRLRRQLVPLGAVVGLELVLLTFLAGRNFQPRFSVNLAPLVALAATLWIPVVSPAGAPDGPRRGRRHGPGRCSCSPAGARRRWPPRWPRLREPRQGGRLPRHRPGSAALPGRAGERDAPQLAPAVQPLGEAPRPGTRRPRCWSASDGPGPEQHPVLLLVDGTQPRGDRTGWRPLGAEVQMGTVRGQLFEVEPPGARRHR